MGEVKHDGKFMSTVKVGPKGQIVIPKEVRDMFGIETGSVLILLADRERGIAINSLSAFSSQIESMITGQNEFISDAKKVLGEK